MPIIRIYTITSTIWAITNRLDRQGHADELLVDGADVRLAGFETDLLGRHYRK
jgi:hypothetical protein